MLISDFQQRGDLGAQIARKRERPNLGRLVARPTVTV